MIKVGKTMANGKVRGFVNIFPNKIKFIFLRIIPDEPSNSGLGVNSKSSTSAETISRFVMRKPCQANEAQFRQNVDERVYGN